MIFELWRLEWKRDRQQRSYEKDIKKAVKAKDHKKANDLREEAAHFYSGDNDLIDSIRSQRLVRKAIRLQIPRPPYDDETSWNNWHYGYVLTDKGYDELRSKIMTFENERVEHRTRWVKIGLPIGTFILGVLGTYLAMKKISEHPSNAQTELQQKEHKADKPK